VDYNKANIAYTIAAALAHPLRMRIVNYIQDNPSTKVNRIYKYLNIEQSVTSKHLSLLKKANIVTSITEGKYRRYSISDNYDNYITAIADANYNMSTDKKYIPLDRGIKIVGKIDLPDPPPKKKKAKKPKKTKAQQIVDNLNRKFNS